MLSLGDLICTAAMAIGKVFVFIDALDECEQRTGLLPILERFSHFISLFITSRDEGDIPRSLGQCLGCQIPIWLEDTADEIQEFVRDEIKGQLHRGLLHV
jgi:hypothetical protein